jgi:hypothetical protein
VNSDVGGTAYAEGAAEAEAVNGNRHTRADGYEQLETYDYGVAAGTNYANADSNNNVDTAYAESSSYTSGNGYSYESASAHASH